LIIRSYRDSDLANVVECFEQSVRVIVARYYRPDQVALWAPATPDMDSWRLRLSTGGVFVADIDEAIAGFVRATEDGLVDLLYVHPQHERRNVGWSLLDVACDWCAARGAKVLEANVSLAGRPLFEAAGFHVQREQSVEYRGTQFRNFRMRRRP
jgi:putative acetyltransferase